MLARILSLSLASCVLFACAAGTDDPHGEPFTNDPGAPSAAPASADAGPPIVEHAATATPPIAPSAPEATPDETPTTCETAKDLGEVDGDSGEWTKSGQGKCSGFYRLRMKETVGFDLIPLSLSLDLVSPADEKFDLFVYVDTKKDQLECKTPLVKSDTPVGNVDSLDASWGDTPFSDDSRTVSIEVRSHSGKCSTQGTYSLLLTRKQTF